MAEREVVTKKGETLEERLEALLSKVGPDVVLSNGRLW